MNPEERMKWRERLEKVQGDYLSAKQRCDKEKSVENLRSLRQAEAELDRLQSVFSAGRLVMAS